MCQHVCAELVPIFNHLDRASLIQISSITEHRTYRQGEVIFSPRQSDRLLILARGRIKVYSLSESGKEQLLRVLEPGDFIGVESLFGGESADTWGEALTELELCTIKREDFMALLAEYPSISFKLLEEYSRRLHAAEQLITRTATEPIATRLLLYLQDLQKVQGGDAMQLPLTMRELATHLGTTPETISRRMRQLEEKGWIRRNKKSIYLLRTDALEENGE